MQGQQPLQVGVKAVKGFGDFEASLNKAAIVAGGTSKDIEGLADVANRMGKDLPLSAQDAADAMIVMAQNGASLETIKKISQQSHKQQLPLVPIWSQLLGLYSKQ